MIAKTHAASRYSKKTTDAVRFGCDTGGDAWGAPNGLTDLTADLTAALGHAYWSFMLQAELEDAFDTALLWAAIAETPTLSGSGIALAS